MKDKFPNLKWVVVMRHAPYDDDDIPTKKSKDFINSILGPAISRKIPILGRGKEILITSHELRGVVTGNHLSRSLDISSSIGIGSLQGDSYFEGKLLVHHVCDYLPQQTEVAIIIGHFEAVPGMANAIVSSFGQTIECFEPKYLDGVVINMETGEHHVGINKFFGVN